MTKKYDRMKRLRVTGMLVMLWVDLHCLSKAEKWHQVINTTFVFTFPVYLTSWSCRCWTRVKVHEWHQPVSKSMHNILPVRENPVTLVK